MMAVLTSRKMDMTNWITTRTCRNPSPRVPDFKLPFSTSVGRKPERYTAG